MKNYYVNISYHIVYTKVIFSCFQSDESWCGDSRETCKSIKQMEIGMRAHF